MSDESVDTLAGLSIAENELERVMGELDEMYSRLNIHLLEWVSLWPLKWALSKLGGDLNTVDTELRGLRIAVASARSEAELARATLVAAVEADTQCNDALRHELDEARQKQLEKQLECMSFYNGLSAELNTVKAELVAARKQVAELTTKEVAEPINDSVGTNGEGQS